MTYKNLFKEKKMAQIKLKGNVIHTKGNLPAVGSQAPNFTLTKTDLSELNLKDLSGKKIVLNIFPSIDTPTCATSVRTFNKEAANLSDTVVICASADLPFAQARFCGAEGLNNVVPASDFRHKEFGDVYGARIIDGPIAGLLSRAIVVIDANGRIAHTEQVAEVSHEPNYQAALAAIQQC
jgi:thiol peroxidase